MCLGGHIDNLLDLTSWPVRVLAKDNLSGLRDIAQHHKGVAAYQSHTLCNPREMSKTWQTNLALLPRNKYLNTQPINHALQFNSAG
jgi:hypothetical protein